MNFKKLSLGFIYTGTFLIVVSFIWWNLAFGSYLSHMYEKAAQLGYSSGMVQRMSEPSSMLDFSGCLLTSTYGTVDGYGNHIAKSCGSIASYSPIFIQLGLFMLTLGIILLYSIPKDKNK
jgi:hypothetical protein